MPKKIVWAVDAFEESSGPQLQVAEIIKRFQAHGPTVVKPVHILGPSELNLSAEFVGPWVGQYLPGAEQALGRLTGALGLSDIESPEIITQTSSSTSRSADALIDYAERFGADLILVGSHGRTGVSRLLLGSFAETLLMRSRVPVVVVGQHLGANIDFGQMIAPTDFAEHSKDVFKSIVGFAGKLGARITLYHAILKPVAPIYQSGVYVTGNPWIPVQEYFGRSMARHRRRLNSWADWAAHQGVETDSLIDTETANISDSILELAHRKNAGWIALAAESGPLASALLGSVTRRVVRAADCPVWVVRLPKAQEARHPRAA